MIFPSRSQLASKQITRTGRAEAVTKEGLAATLLPGRQPDQMGQRHSLRPVRPRSCPGPLRNGGATGDGRIKRRLKIVSIRAPARGATTEVEPDKVSRNVSIRAPARGATSRFRAWRGINVFQSAPRTGGDALSKWHPFSETCFNPRPRTGGDRISTTSWTPSWRFNPRPRTGGDTTQVHRRLPWLRFNPRPRTGGDSLSNAPTDQDKLFQSAPPHGGRLAWRELTGGDRSVSIRAPARGATNSTTQATS